MDALFQDLKFAARQLWKGKGFLAAAGLTLALCIGANTALFSVVNAVIFRPLAVEDPDALVIMWNAYPGAVGTADFGQNSAPDFFDRRPLVDVFAEVAEFGTRGVSLELGGVPQRVRSMLVTPSFFPMLGATPADGRVFLEEEGEVGASDVVVLSTGLAEELFGVGVSPVGGDLRIDGREHRVVGVMPRTFAFFEDEVRLWRPLTFTPEDRQAIHSNNWQMVARLAPGATIDQARERVAAVNAANADAMPELKPILADAGFFTRIEDLQETMVRDVAGVLYFLWAGVAFVLMIGVVNIASLELVRSSARSKELATRFALGAGRARVVRQLITESLVLTFTGGLLGIGVGALALSGLRRIGLDDLPRAAEVSLDAQAVGFTLGLALLVGAVVSLVPITNVLRTSLTSVIREEGRSGTASRGVRLLRKGLVAAQVAFALVLLAGAGLLFASFRQVLAVNPGFDPRGVLSGMVVLDSNAYPEVADRNTFMDEMLGRLQALPGVTAAAATTQLPFTGNYSDSVIFAEGYVMKEGESPISPARSVVSPGYFEALGIPLLQGREFDGRDGADAAPVIIIDRVLAERFFADGEVLGKRMWQPTSMDSFTDPTQADFYDIVGVADAVQLNGVDGIQPPGAYYFPMSQAGFRAVSLVVKAAVEPTELAGPMRKIVAELDADMALFDVASMDARIERSLTGRRTPMMLSMGFGGVALLLVAVGLYGVLASIVQMRTREIGIRMALGSEPRAVFGLVLREGLVIVATGLAIGIAGTIAARRFIESQLYQTSASDPGVLLGVGAALAVVAVVACWLPARRATRIDPVAALSQD